MPESNLQQMMEKKVVDNISINMTNTSDTQRIVIFAEEHADNVYWKDGMPIIDKRPRSFANAARNWAEANTQIAYQKPVVGPDGVTTYETAYKPAEIMIVVGYGKDQITKAFNDVKSANFVDDDTKLIIMGHAGSTFGGEDAGMWGNIMKDTKMRDKFSQVAYGACSQGESVMLCQDLSRSFGPETEVLAQVGQPWGPGSTYNIYTTMDYETGQARGPNFTTEHQPPKEWHEQVFTVGSGHVKFYANYKGAELIDPGWGNYEIDRGGFSLQEADAFVGAHQDPKLRKQYWEESEIYRSPTAEFEESYALANPEAVVEWEDRPDYIERAARDKDDWNTMKQRVLLDLTKEWWAETHDGEELPKEYIWDQGTIDAVGFVGTSMPRADEDAFLEWYYKKEEDAIASGEMTYTVEQINSRLDSDPGQMDFLNYYHGQQTYGHSEDDSVTLLDYAQFVGSKRLAEQRKIPLTSEEVRLQEEYDISYGEWNTAFGAYHQGMTSEYQSGLDEPVPPPWIGGEHMLDLEDNITVSFEDMIKEPARATDMLVNDKDGKLRDGIRKLEDLYTSGNPAAVTAYKEAYQKMLVSGIPEYKIIGDDWREKNSPVFQNLLEIEALRLYALSGTGEQYRDDFRSNE